MRIRLAIPLLLAAAPLLGVAGCGGSAPPAQNAELASELDVLKEGLEAWKNGGTPAALESGAKPLQFTDADWKAGTKLLEYRIVKAGGEDDGEMVCTVGLKLDARGKSVDKTVTYRVTLTPKRTVTRAVKG